MCLVSFSTPSVIMGLLLTLSTVQFVCVCVYGGGGNDGSAHSTVRMSLLGLVRCA